MYKLNIYNFKGYKLVLGLKFSSRLLFSFRLKWTHFIKFSTFKFEVQVLALGWIFDSQLLFSSGLSFSSQHIDNVVRIPRTQTWKQDISWCIDWFCTSNYWTVHWYKMAAQYILAYMFLVVTLLGSTTGVPDEEFQVGYMSYHMFIHKFCDSNCWIVSFTQTYVDWFQSLDPIVAEIIGQLKEEIRELKGEIKRNKEMEGN